MSATTTETLSRPPRDRASSTSASAVALRSSVAAKKDAISSLGTSLKRPDTKVPVVGLQGERELLVTVAVYGSLGYRRRDSSTYRLYEVAGISHVNNEPDNPVAAFGKASRASGRPARSRRRSIKPRCGTWRST